MARECPTGKKSFKNKGDATNFMVELRRKNPTTVNVRNVYQCEQCGKWHMTSQPRHGRKLRMGKTIRFIPMDDIAAAAFEIRSAQLLEPEELRAPARQEKHISRLVTASKLRDRNPIHTEPTRSGTEVAQSSSSAC